MRRSSRLVTHPGGALVAVALLVARYVNRDFGRYAADLARPDVFSACSNPPAKRPPWSSAAPEQGPSRQWTH